MACYLRQETADEKANERETGHSRFDNKTSRWQNILSMQSPETFHVVVTDINYNVRHFLQRELEKDGYSVADVKTGALGYERIFSHLPLNLIILDPELFYDFDELFLEKIARQRPSLQVIIHTYADSIPVIEPRDTIHIVEKNGGSIASIRLIVRTCFAHFEENNTSSGFDCAGS